MDAKKASEPKKKIVLTGGGTAGHVMPNLALLPALAKEGWDPEYIGSATGIEKQLVEAQGLRFHAIPSGKLRRYLDLKNFTDPFRVAAGVVAAWSALGRIKPKVVFSKGGFVAVPVVVAARMRGIPIIIHESDITPGLANRISIPCANIICAGFPETAKHLPADKVVVTGAPIRGDLFLGDPAKGRAYLGFSGRSEEAHPLPILLIMGGSLGSKILNQAVDAVLPEMLKRFQVVHLRGKGGLNDSLTSLAGYYQAEFIGPELADVLAAADLVLSRAGANALFELLALQKPHLLVPLSKAASRGDQILNAEAFVSKGYSRVLAEENLGGGRLMQELLALEAGADIYREAMGKSSFRDGAEKVMAQIRRFA